VTNAADFSTNILDAKTLGGLAGADTLTVAECREQLESFSSGIDSHKKVPLKKN
jgi:hypothetical protein